MKEAERGGCTSTGRQVGGQEERGRDDVEAEEQRLGGMKMAREIEGE